MIKPGPLAIGDLTAWLALRRVNEGGVALLDGSYYHYGRAVPHYLNAPLVDLVKAGWLMLAEVDPEVGGMRKVTLTEGGRELYATLCGKRGVSPDPRVNQFLDLADRVECTAAVTQPECDR